MSGIRLIVLTVATRLGAMLPLQTFSTRVLTDLIRRQPPSPARTTFAWQLAVGPQLARATTVELRGGVLTVIARDAQWRAEIERARPTILKRLQELLNTHKLEITVEIPDP
jgi:predicted nucleic acid-binding Zn ribbon protein